MILFRRRKLLTLAGALLISSLILAQFLPAQEQSPGQYRVWKVKDSSARLWIEKGRLVSASGQKIAESIPLSTIRVLTYETISEHPAAGMMKAWIEDCLDNAHEQGLIVFPMAGGTALVSLFLPLKSTRHLVNVEWARDGENELRVFLLSKADARSFLNELQKATGIQWSDANHIGSSKRLALEQSSAEINDSVGRLQHGRLAFGDRGYSFPSAQITPLPATPPDCTSLSSDYDMRTEHVRRHLQEAVRNEESPQNLAPPESSKPTLRLNTSPLWMKSILREIKPC